MGRPSYLIVLLVVCSTLRSCVVAVQFSTYEEMLRYVEKQQNPGVNEEGFLVITAQPPITHRQEEDAGLDGGSGHDVLVQTTSFLPTTTMQVMETEVPMTTRPMTTCCRLGEEAGMKRHHCDPDNYMPSFRNRNRGHNFKESNRHPSLERSQFDKCTSGIVRRLAEEFKTCCQEAYKRMWQLERGDDNPGNGRIHLIEVPLYRKPAS